MNGAMIERVFLFVITIITPGNGEKRCDQSPIGGVKCEFDPVCYEYAADCTIPNEIEPFHREQPMECLECSALCQNFRNDTLHDKYVCRSLVWDACGKTCDIFDISIPIPLLAKRPGRIYLQPNYNCRPPVPPTTFVITTLPPVPIINSCKNVTDVPKILVVKNRRLANITGEEFLGVAGPTACAQYCLANQFPNGTLVDCKSSQYTDGVCTITSSQQAILAAELVPEDGSVYLQKICFPASLAQNCDDFLIEDPNMIIVGVNKLTVDAVSLEECVKECMKAKTVYGFVCKSLMFYYQDLNQNCILNEQTKGTKRDQFTSSPEGEDVSYVEVPCQAGGGSTNVIEFADKPLAQNEGRNQRKVKSMSLHRAALIKKKWPWPRVTDHHIGGSILQSRSRGRSRS